VITSGSPGSFPDGITVFHDGSLGALHEPHGAPPLNVGGYFGSLLTCAMATAAMISVAIEAMAL
jgi:hypothetical protein